jgi:hypothetical protein
MTLDELHALVERLQARVDVLEAERESLKAWRYVGVWDRATSYRANNFVTHAGATWIARSDSRGARPGSGDGAWTLTAKSGRDAR